MAKKKLLGKIIALNTKDTAVVDVETVKVHERYKKRYKVNKKYLSHYTDSTLTIGDKVVIEETRPLSKRKTWIVSNVVEKGR